MRCSSMPFAGSTAPRRSERSVSTSDVLRGATDSRLRSPTTRHARGSSGAGSGCVPGGGVVYLGRDGARTSIRFGPALTAAENLLRDAERLQRAEEPPKLLLNDHCRVCTFRDRCRDQAVREDNLSLLRGIGEKTIKGYARKGVLTLTQLAHTFRPKRRGKRADAALKRRDHALHALAIRDQTIYVLGAPKLPNASVRIYLDIEGDPEDGFDYLIGLVVCEGERVERHSFWADDRKGEAEIFARFLEIVARYDAPHLYCYGSYEKVFFAHMRRHARRKKCFDAVLAKLTNVLTIIYPHVYFPTYSNGLKDVAGCLGYSWAEPDASGIESVVWRKNWEKTGDASWKAKLIQYNLEDCEALRRVCAFLSHAANEATKGPNPHDATLRVASVAELDKLARTVTWTKFGNADFEFVNKRAYFDYQRRHVFVRTKSAQRKPKPQHGAPTLAKPGLAVDTQGGNQGDSLSLLQGQAHRASRPEAASEGPANETKACLRSRHHARSDAPEGDRVQGGRLSLRKLRTMLYVRAVRARQRDTFTAS